jgi:2-phospho-L-lactate/phosphoenolpyruvate guanylyltransferase
MRIALIPMKALRQAKMRLADVLDRRGRAELALAMLTDVVAACDASGCFDRVVVASNDDAVFEHARDLGATLLAEPASVVGLNDSLAFGQQHSVRLGAGELVILPADVPLARAADIHAVVDALATTPGSCAVLVRSRDNGTNSLALRPPDAVAMHFGRNSADEHRAAAEAAGITVIEVSCERLAYDIDAPEDLAALPDLPVGAATRGWIDAHARYAAER